MPTKKELLDQLKKKALRVLFLEKHYEVNKKDYYEFYRYYYTDERGVLRSEAVCIHVIVDEKGNEHAYWKDRIPTVLISRSATFLDELMNMLNKKKSEIGFLTFMVDQVDENSRTAIVRTFKSVDQEAVQEIRIVVWKDDEGAWHFKRIQ